MSFQMILCLSIFALVIIGFASSILPMPLVSMIGMVLMMITGCLDGSDAISYFSSTTAVMLGGMFIVASAFSKTQVVDKLSKSIIRVSKGSFRKVTAGYVLLALVVGQLINSSSALFCMIYPLALSCCKEMKVSPSKIMYPIAVTCMGTAGIIPSTAAIAMCEVWRPYYEAYEITQYTYSVTDYCLAKLPLAILIVLFAIFITPRYLPDRLPQQTEDASSSKAEKQNNAYTSLQEIVVIIAFIIMILGVAFGSKIGVPGWEVCMIAAIVVIVCGALRGNEVYTSMGLPVIFLLVGGTGMAKALQQTGAAEWIGNVMISLFGSHPNGYVVGLAFFVLPMLLAQLITNAPANGIFVPIALMACKAFGGNPVGPMFLAIIGSLCGFLTPMANATTSIMYSVGGYTIKDIASFKVAPLLMIASTVISVLWVMTIFPLY